MKMGRGVLPCLLVVVLTVATYSAEGLSASQFGKDRFAVVDTKTATETSLSPVISTVDFGQDKFVDLFLPADSRQFSKSTEKDTKITTQDGRGDVVWPAGFALSRLIAHFPSLVDGKNVLELGCGLGAAAAAACKYARPNHVALTDRDKASLALAYASCVQLQRSRASVSRCCMDWSDPSSWPAQDYNVLLAADVLYDKANILPFVSVLQHYLCSHDSSNEKLKRAVIVDPISQVNRDAFIFAAYKAGLEVEQEEFPGSPDLMLLSIYPFA
jgi:SAM-dependent methyltransferase